MCLGGVGGLRGGTGEVTPAMYCTFPWGSSSGPQNLSRHPDENDYATKLGLRWVTPLSSARGGARLNLYAIRDPVSHEQGCMI